jgi:hypothetical protein
MDTLAIERLIKISIDKPLMPETYVPWENKLSPSEHVLPDHLISIEGLEEYKTLSKEQIDEVRRHEVVQFMYSYAWGEGLLNAFLTRQIYTTLPESAEYRFILREIIEESRHQEMFLRGITLLHGAPIPPTRTHAFWGKFSSRYFPPTWMFLVAISSELVADAYGRHVQADKNMYSTLRKMAELHQIEEGRHIAFTKLYLEKHILNAGFIKRSVFSIIIALNVQFVRTMYVKQEIFDRAGISNSKKLYQKARAHYRNKFSEYCLNTTIEFVKEMNGFNSITRPFWKRLLNVKFS